MRIRGLAGIVFAGVMAVVLSVMTAPASAASVMVRAADVSNVGDGSVITITARVIVQNADASAIQSVVILFPDGTQVAIGDIGPGEERDGGVYLFTVNTAVFMGRHTGVPLQIQFVNEAGESSVVQTGMGVTLAGESAG